MPSEWTPSTWRDPQFTNAQPVTYPPQSNSEAEIDHSTFRRKQSLEQVRNQLQVLPGLVSPLEIEKLKKHLAAVSRGEAFLLQGGDCAELFDYCNSEKIQHRLSLLLSMSLILIWGMKLPVVRVARIAGQYAKPRSKPTETINGVELPSFRGDNVNGFDATPESRLPDPERLLMAYFYSSASVNHIRTLLASGFASLPSNSSNGFGFGKTEEAGIGPLKKAPWSLPLSHVRNEALLESYESIVKNLGDALQFLDVVGGSGAGDALKPSILDSAEIFVSHEGLMLEYESALTRKMVVPAFARVQGEEMGFYCTSAHFLWIGDRTRALDGAHIEFFRGLRNPIGVKVGPSMAPDELIELLTILDPLKEPGRITLITRYGADKIENHLPAHILAVKQAGFPVVWCVDPMHGNTKTAEGGIKTRDMADIVSEISSALKVHARLGSRVGGVHLELTGDTVDGQSVTECTGGSMELGEEMLGLRFESTCDPRLNFEQSLDVAFMLSSQYQGIPNGRSPHAHILENLTSRSRERSTDSLVKMNK